MQQSACFSLTVKMSTALLMLDLHEILLDNVFLNGVITFIKMLVSHESFTDMVSCFINHSCIVGSLTLSHLELIYN